MPKGKRGPRPESKPTEEKRVALRYACSTSGCEFVGKLEEWEAHRDETNHAEYYMKQVTIEDPTAEEIVGKENIVDVGDPGPVPGEEQEQQPPERQGYKCSLPGCTFQTSYLSEMEEHVSGTGHGSYATDTLDPAPTQLELPGIVRVSVEVPIDPAVLNEKRAKLAELYEDALVIKSLKKNADAGFNAQLTAIDGDMQAIARILRTPVTYERVEAEWRIIDGENARGLYRLDTGEMIEKQALSIDDRQMELDKAEADNAAPEPEIEPEAQLQ